MTTLVKDFRSPNDVFTYVEYYLSTWDSNSCVLYESELAIPEWAEMVTFEDIISEIVDHLPFMVEANYVNNPDGESQMHLWRPHTSL